MTAESRATWSSRARAAALHGCVSLFGLVGSVAWAQDAACRMVDSSSGPPRQILTCPSGPIVEAEAKAGVHVVDKGEKGHPSAASIDGGAALIEIPEGYPGGFEVTTPRAVATVRGTIWVVDVKPDGTSVFVLRGEVLVRRPGSDQSAVLTKGEGVDVADDGKPLDVIHWPADRAAALLARFGR